jgi:hypothetical protein
MPDILSLFPTGDATDAPAPATVHSGADILSMFPTEGAPATTAAVPTDTTGAPDTVNPVLRRALEPAPNTTYGSVLPLAKDNKTGDIRFALPSSLRDLASGGLDLIEGPWTGTVTPAGTNALANAMIGGAYPSVARGTGAAIAADSTVAPLSSEFRQNPLAADAGERLTQPDIAPGPTSANPNRLTEPGASGLPPPAVVPNGLTPAQIAEFTNIPDSLPPTNQPIKTPADAAARADQIINHFASIGNRTPIPGAEGALPTITGNAGLATLYRAVRDSDTPVPFTTLENASKAKAMAQLRTMAGTPDDLASAVTDRATTVKPMYDAAWANKTAADPSAAIQTVQDFMKSPAKQNDTVMAELPGILKKLQGETDPEQLKGISDNIDATLQRLGTEGKADRETRRVLGAVKESITPAISDAAPGFDAAQAEYSRQSRRVDEMTYLQGRKLTDLQGNPTLGNMRSTLDDIAKKQAGDKFNPADSVTSDNLKTLQRLHDQMQREQFTASAGKALGSNTFQNLATNSRVASLTGHVGNALAGGVIGGGIDLLSGGGGMTGMLTGNALGGAAKYYAGRSAANAAASAATGQKMLMCSDAQ